MTAPPPVTTLPYGEQAVLLECRDAALVPAVLAAARDAFPDAVEIVPAATTVLLDGVDPAVVAPLVGGWRPAPAAGPEGPLVEIPVRYDGPDLAAIAEHWGMSVEAAVARHRDREYVVAFCGFAPGFAYCSGLTAAEAVPRRSSPRARVPAGSVAVADTWTAVYPTASPGGWHLLGSTDTVLWDPDASPPALLQPGTRVRFVDA